jgi:autotransporter-associated beta strand protein
LSGNIINSGSLTKIGAGTLTLTGTNTYSGGTNLNGVILAVNSDGNLGTGALSLMAAHSKRWQPVVESLQAKLSRSMPGAAHFWPMPAPPRP